MLEGLLLHTHIALWHKVIDFMKFLSSKQFSNQTMYCMIIYHALKISYYLAIS